MVSYTGQTHELNYVSYLSGWWESNPRSSLGRALHYRYATPALKVIPISYSSCPGCPRRNIWNVVLYQIFGTNFGMPLRKLVRLLLCGGGFFITIRYSKEFFAIDTVQRILLQLSTTASEPPCVPMDRIELSWEPINLSAPYESEGIHRQIVASEGIEPPRGFPGLLQHVSWC